MERNEKKKIRKNKCVRGLDPRLDESPLTVIVLFFLCKNTKNNKVCQSFEMIVAQKMRCKGRIMKHLSKILRKVRGNDYD